MPGTDSVMSQNTPPKPAAWLVDDARFDAHALGGPEHLAYHPERPERLVAARAAIARGEVDWHRVEAREATTGELVRVHDLAYIESLDRRRGDAGYLDPDTYIAPRSVEAARLAVGGAVALVDKLIDTDVTRGVALLRPPGHHARAGQAMGFCLLNSVAVAAAHATARGLTRVLVVDWDVHHGNGTQEMFWRSPEVLYISLHQFPFYPGTGAAEETGEGDGQGFTVNVPLSSGGGDDVYRAAFERAILPVAHEFAPELVLISAGFDASVRDPLAQMRLSADAFGWMGKALRGVADASAGGRIALVLEGGYDLVGLESGLASAIAGVVHGEAEEIAQPTGIPEDVARAARVTRRGWKVG
jgi:acetoin utilization deacetylase AcuC-like enzyme